VTDGPADDPVETSEPTPVNVPDPAAARDAVLATLAENYGDKAPALGLSWVEENVTAEGLVGGSTFQYTANGWVVKVTFPLVNPAATVYHVVVTNKATGFDCEGDVDADGVVTELADPEAMWFDPPKARDAVLAYLAQNYGDRAPASGLTWAETDVKSGLPDKPVPGSTSLQYVAADWAITLSYPVVRPDLVVYQVTVQNAELGFKWEGKVDASGQVTELAAPSAETTVVAWYGYVVSTPDGAQFDDFVTILPEGQFGEFGIEGADESIEAEIVALRDHKKYANFWGTLRCDVIDYGGCQLLVTRIRSGMDMTDPEPVEGWEGTIVELFYDEPGAPHPDDAFILVGDYPVRYGITSYIDENGWPIYKEELEKRRDTGQTIRVWGQLVCGFPDVNACQIQVNRIEIDGTEVDAYEGWATYTNKEYGFSFRYPDTWEMVEQGEISGEPLPDVGTFIELGQGDWVFMIGVRHSSEDTNIFVNRTESLEQMGQVYFLGQEVPRMVWIQDDRTLAVRYGEVDIPPSWSSDCPPESVLFGGVIKEDNLVFTLSLWEFGDDWSNTADISPEVQVEVDQIISSFELTE
jgi:hypothetical protein